MTGLKVTLFITFLLIVVCALAYFLFPEKMAEVMVMPQDPVQARYAGLTLLGLAVAMWYAFRNPVKNAAIVQVAFLIMAFYTLLGLYHGFTGQEEWQTALPTVVVSGLLALALAIFYPGGAKAT